MLTREEVVSLTLLHEAGNQPIEGIVAVGCVIRNRVLAPGWWGTDYVTVCRHPKQFSCWNDDGSANHARLMAHVAALLRQDGHVEDPGYRECQLVASGIVSGVLRDRTLGATHYYYQGIAPPIWTNGAAFLEQIGQHLFFKGVH